ncbi:hypothetical protein ACFQ3S_16235 [Mucilaginibacter terrae]|uniref:hypothetical protein n=1 Tax=Mucilaginibacter terrae TaxID=1955052 RepID=UPI0036264915
MAKSKQQVISGPSVGFAGYFLLGYWIFFALVHFTIDIFIDLYTDEDYLNVFWYAAAIALPFAAYTLYLGRQSLFTSWYMRIIFPLIMYGLYLGSAYFTILKLDLLMSTAIKPVTEQVLPVKNIQQVYARKAGFIHTNVTLVYQQRLVTFEGTRTSYFLLKPYKALQVKIGRSYLGSYYINHINIAAHERWAARKAYFKNWFDRYYWLLIAFPLLFAFGWLKDKYFPAYAANLKVVEKPYYKFFKRLFVILVTLFGLFILVLLLVGLPPG